MKQKTAKNPKGAGAPKKAPTKMVRIPIAIAEDVTKLKENHLKNKYSWK